MITLPADMLAAAGSIPPAEEWLIACIKMPSGDVWLSDRPASPELRAMLTAEPLAAVEDWGVLDDGGTVDGLMSTGSTGNLECPTIKITVLRADQTKAQVDAIINQGVHNRRIELYRWFTGMTSAPVLIDTLFIQDKIELAESSMLWSFEAVGCLAAENPRMSELDDKGRSWPYVIGKAQGVPLTLLESESNKWTELIGDADGNEVTDEYTGLIRVEDATKLTTGAHIINGEQVYLVSASVGYMSLSHRGRNGTEAQEHSSGSRIFPVGAVFKYAVCSGPVESLEKLRTSNEIDIYDEDLDGDVTEYRDLYNGGNETLKPELNPAQIWFSDRMPFFFKEQENQIDDKAFYGIYSSFSKASLVERSIDINKKDGLAKIKIPFQEFSLPSADYWFRDTTIPVPGMPGERSYSASENILNNLGYFSVKQSTGEYNGTTYEGCSLTSTAYREFRINGTCPNNEAGWTMVAPDLPEDEGFFAYTSFHYWAIILQSAVTYKMDFKIEIHQISPTGGEGSLFTATFLGKIISSVSVHTCNYTYSGIISGFETNTYNNRIRIRLTCLDKASSDAYAYIRVGGRSVYSDKLHYGLAMLWKYYDNAPSAWISSQFGKNLSSKGTFVSAKAKIKGKIKNTNDFSDGTLKIFEDSTEKFSSSITDGTEIDEEIELSATTWIELQNLTVKVQMQLDYLGKVEGSSWKGIPRIAGEAGFDFDGGIQWLLTYTSTTLDGLQINYADQLYVDVVSTHGPDWTPARAVRWISEDKTTWAADMLNTDALDDRHAEYAAAGHILNGLRAEERYQDVIREVLRQGFARPIQSGGKLSIVNHLTDAAALPVITAGLDDLFSKSQTFTTTDTPQLVQKIIVFYNKNLSTGEWDGKHELSTGQPVHELMQIDLDMINSTAAVQLAAAWLYALKTVQLQVFGYAVNFRMLSAQKADKMNLPSFLLDNELREMLAVNVKQDFGKGKTGKMTKFLIQAIRRV